MGISLADEGLKQDQVISYFHCPDVQKSIVNLVMFMSGVHRKIFSILLVSILLGQAKVKSL